MSLKPTTPIIEQMSDSVKPTIKKPSSLLSDSVIHHNVSSYPHKKIIVSYKTLNHKPYGVSSSRRVLSTGLLLKRFDEVRNCLQYRLGLTVSQREVVLRLLRMWAYYGYCYPKEALITSEPGCSKATYWRTIRRLEDVGLLSVVNRYVIRPHAQISNLYLLDQLVLVLARYISERREFDCPRWLTPVLTMPDRTFWSFLSRVPGDRAGPCLPAFEDLLSSRAEAS